MNDFGRAEDSCIVRSDEKLNTKIPTQYNSKFGNCFPDKDDIIDLAKYDTNSLNCHSSRSGIFFRSSEGKDFNSKPHIISIIDETKFIPDSDRYHPSAIRPQHNGHIISNATKTNIFSNNNPLAPIIYDRKESPKVPLFAAVNFYLFLLAISLGSQEYAVSCMGLVFGDSSIRNDHHLSYYHPIFHSSSHRQLNLNTSSWSVPSTNHPNSNHHPPMDQLYHGGGDPLNNGMPTSAIESFYSDQNSQSAQSPTAPIANGWSSSSSMLPSTSLQDSLDKHVKNILVPRVSGTAGNVKVRQYIIDSLEANDYTVQLDEFFDNTPIGKVKFANIIAYSNPNACRQLVMACHYDSKMMEGFLGAVDSAVPCAMLLKMSETLKTSFRGPKEDESSNKSIGLQFLFFDGEEAFVEWGPTDSLYGSRHLAAKWDKQKAPPQCSSTNELGRIELLVLLDLIGSKDTYFVVYTSFDPALNRRIQAHHEKFRKYEKAYLMSQSGGSLSTTQANRQAAFKTRQMSIHFVEDDHVPFMRRGVPILSLLASPFPKVWHTVADNYDAIDFPKTRRILHVLEQWLANYEQTSA